MSRTDIQDTLREMWETRPARPRAGRQVAGVAAGIAHRYDIDPVLVRVGFVVAAFTGIGAALYIAGWFLLPNETADPNAPATGRPRPWIVIGLAIATAISLGSMFGGDGGSGFLLPVLAVGGLLFLLHRSRGDHRAAAPAGTAADQPTVATAAAPGLASHPTDPTAGADGSMPGSPGSTPPAWDPLGAAPFAWDLPEPAQPVEPVEPPRRRLPVTPITLGLALIAGSVTGVIMLLAGTFTVLNLPVLLGVVLAVLGGGLLVGAFLRAGRGLIPIALVLAAITWAVVAAPLERLQGDRAFGELHAAPTTVAALQPDYRIPAGEIELDLRNLDLSVPPGGDASPVHTTISLGAGDVSVRVPETADISMNGRVGFGDLTFGDRQESGLGETTLNVTDDLGTDGMRSGRPLVLDIEAGAGDVEVQRG